MTFLQIEYFLEIVKSGSFTKAAEKLYISHQSLSVQMKALEKELGFPLFDRRNRRVQSLTESGEVLYNAWTNVLGIHKEAIQKASNSYTQQFHSIRIGVQNIPYIRDVTLREINEFVEKNSLKFEFVTNDPEILIEKLNLGQLDFCSVISHTLLKKEGYYTKEIGEKRSFPVIVVSKSNPLSKKDHVTLKDIQNETILVLDENYSKDVIARVKADFAEAGIADINLKKMKSVNEIKMALLMNQGVTILLDLAMIDVLDKVRLYEFKIPGEEDQAKIIMVWKDKKWNTMFSTRKKGKTKSLK